MLNFCLSTGKLHKTLDSHVLLICVSLLGTYTYGFIVVDQRVSQQFRRYLLAYLRVINFYADGLVGLGHASPGFQFFDFLPRIFIPPLFAFS